MENGARSTERSRRDEKKRGGGGGGKIKKKKNKRQRETRGGNPSASKYNLTSEFHRTIETVISE